MIDFLLGIDFLLALQNLRESLPDFVTSFFLFISSPFFYLFLGFGISLVFFWCIDKKSASLISMSLFITMALWGMIKDLVKQPRPWVISDKLHPYGNLPNDYSFPSGHTSNMVAQTTSVACILKKHWATFVFIILMILVMFSRMYLGVHTPLDLIGGVILSIVAVLISVKLIDIAYIDDKHFNIVMIGYIIFAGILYTAWMIWGNLMDHIDDNLVTFAVPIGLLIERNFIHYEIPKMTKKQAVIRFLQGLVIALVVFLIPFLIFNNEFGMGLGGFFMMLVSLTLTPMLFKRIDSRCGTI